MEIRRSLFVSCLLVVTAAAGLAPAQTVTGASVQPSQTSLTLPAGKQVYIYGMATGGNYASSNLSQGSFCQLTDADGNVNAGLAVTTSNSNSFNTSALYYTMGGIAVSGSTTMTQYCAANNSPGANTVSDTFNLTQNSLVVVIAISGGEASLTLSGISGLQIDGQAGNPTGGVIPMAIAHASLPAGTYTITENSIASPAPGQNPNNMGDLIGVFVFPLAQVQVTQDPGSTSSLLLVNGTINGQNVTPGNRTIRVSPGAAITGSFTASINSSWSSNAVLAMGVTPNWGTPSSSFVDLGGFTTPVSGLQRTINLNLAAPTTPGTYYIIAAFRAEYTAAEVMSCTNWSVGSPNWSSGDAIAGWSAATINTANTAGTVLGNYLFPSGNTPQYVPATAIQVVVTNPPIIVVTNSPIISGSPSAAVQGQTITLTGGGFLAENIVYISSPGVGVHGLRVASTNGTTLTFAVNPAEEFPEGVNTLYVNNANGNSNSISVTVSQ